MNNKDPTMFPGNLDEIPREDVLRDVRSSRPRPARQSTATSPHSEAESFSQFECSDNETVIIEEAAFVPSVLRESGGNFLDRLRYSLNQRMAERRDHTQADVEDKVEISDTRKVEESISKIEELRNSNENFKPSEILRELKLQTGQACGVTTASSDWVASGTSTNGKTVRFELKSVQGKSLSTSVSSTSSKIKETKVTREQYVTLPQSFKPLEIEENDVETYGKVSKSEMKFDAAGLCNLMRHVIMIQEKVDTIETNLKDIKLHLRKLVSQIQQVDQ